MEEEGITTKEESIPMEEEAAEGALPDASATVGNADLVGASGIGSPRVVVSGC